MLQKIYSMYIHVIRASVVKHSYSHLFDDLKANFSIST